MAGGQWWIVNDPLPGGGRLPVQQTHYVIVHSATTPARVVSGPYATKAEAEAALNRAQAYGSNPGSALVQSGKDAVNATGIGGFLQGLTSRDLWRRIAEGGLGILLILAGVAKLAEGSPIATAIKKVPII